MRKVMKALDRKVCVSTVLLAGLWLSGATLLAHAQDNLPQTPAQPVAAVPQSMPAAPEFESTSWILMDYATGQVLASKEPHLRVEPASITKIMTDYVVSSEIDTGNVHLDDNVFISENAWRKGGAGTDGSTSFLEVNSKVPLKDLMYGLIVQSGNDAGIALAEHVAGSEHSFVSLMNKEAERLGMTNTHYQNVTGYPAEGHYSSAYDTAILSRALIHDYPEDYKISSVKEFTWNGITQYNRNSLLWRDDSVDGIKTGHTEKAGYCLAASALRDDQRLIAVVMGAKSNKARVDAVQALLNYGYGFFKSYNIYNAGQELAKPKLWKGDKNTLSIGVDEDVMIALPRDAYDKLKASISMPPHLIAPFAKGDTIGTLTFSLDGDAVLERPIVALEDAKEGGFFGRLWDALRLWLKKDTEDAEVEPALNS